MRGWLLAGILVVGGVVLALRAEPFAPSATLDDPPTVIGKGTTFSVTATDRGSGLAAIEVRLVPGGAADGQSDGIVLATAQFPRLSWLGSGVKRQTLQVSLAGVEQPLADGPARIEVRVRDHSWLSALRSAPQLTYETTIDATPPTVADVESSTAASLGGSAVAIYRVSPDTARSGVQVGELFFPGKPLAGTDGALRATLFAIPYDAADVVPNLVAEDAAGNRSAVPLAFTVKPRKFADKTLEVSDAFLARKVPTLLAQNDLPQPASLLDGYLTVNRDLRRATEERLRRLCAESGAEPHWDGGFARLPNSAPLSGYGDRRTYVHDGKTIDHQTHLGFDLASLKRAPVPAANTGRVVFAAPLDHGLGLFTLYGHLSEVAVKPGETVERGAIIGRTGDTGLAGGDHLHFSTMIHGTHVDPVEWWDPHWIHDRIELRLNAATASEGGEHPEAPERAS
jgi:murein DD-endopeptidase MepM/ murein hydrolase activator NlpD